MANLGVAIDISKEKAETKISGSPLPEGFYPVWAINSDVVDNKNKTGKILKITFEVFEGEHRGRLVFENLNIVHEKEKTVQIAEVQLSKLCLAMGLNPGKINDSNELHHKPLMIKVLLINDPVYGPKNVIDYKADGGITSYEPGYVPPKSAEKKSAAEPLPWQK